MQSILSWKARQRNSNLTKTTLANEHSPSVLESLSLREVTQNMKKVLSAIAQTIIAAKIVFQDDPSKPSLILRVLQSVQDGSDVHSLAHRLPDELQVTTRSLLTQLTSSANFQLLPANLRSYKPYIDLNSSSTYLPPVELDRRLQEWFQSSCDQWQNSASLWLQGLQSLKEVWALRNSMRRFMASSDLKAEELSFIFFQNDSLYHERIIEIWQRVLSEAEAKFRKSLNDQLSSHKQFTSVRSTRSTPCQQSFSY